MSVITKDTTTTFSPSIALGARSRAFRFELEGTNTSNAKVDGLRTIQTRLMLQAYVDLPLRTRIRPYINGGAGFSFISAQVENQYGYLYRRHESDTSFAWNAGGGFTIPISPNWAISLGYRYVDFGDQEVFDTPIETIAHEGYLGVSYEF
ncbi:MAG: outer membrane beta-barrel protein [Alphaproteobacteria bacterium]|nr:outer membrane beta-barrel protein [Alphaproteobacteria bacterium]